MLLRKKYIGESYSGSITVSKTVHGGSNPSSPAFELSIQALSGCFFLYRKVYPIELRKCGGLLDCFAMLQTDGCSTNNNIKIGKGGENEKNCCI